METQETIIKKSWSFLFKDMHTVSLVRNRASLLSTFFSKIKPTANTVWICVTSARDLPLDSTDVILFFTRLDTPPRVSCPPDFVDLIRLCQIFPWSLCFYHGWVCYMVKLFLISLFWNVKHRLFYFLKIDKIPYVVAVSDSCLAHSAQSRLSQEQSGEMLPKRAHMFDGI